MRNILESHTVPGGVEESRIEKYAFETFSLLQSKKSVKKAIKSSNLLLDGDKCKTGNILKSGQRLDLLESVKNPPGIYKLDLKVHFEDNWIAVVKKPAGLRINGNQFKTLENSLLYNLKLSTEKDALKWPRPVHRLDKSTGGLVITAKTSTAIINLGRQFQARVVGKRYRAVVMGKLEGAGEINIPLDGREAITEYSMVEHVPSLKSRWLTLVDLRPKTGRYHQLRRHMLSAGFPILGDSIYGPEGKILKSKGLFLWAVEISFKHPIMGHKMNIRIDEARKFYTYLKREKRRWSRYQ